jgi:hypothetical protein
MAGVGAQQAFSRGGARVSNAPIVLKKSVFDGMARVVGGR